MTPAAAEPPPPALRRRRATLAPLALLAGELLAGALLLAACAPPPAAPGAATGADLAAALVQRTSATPPDTPPGACWAAETAPALVETVTEQVELAPARRAADGTVLRPAAFRSETRQRILRERREVWVETLCPAELTPDLVASLQRALKARGLFPGALTGRMDAATAAALRAWQRPRGLDSDRPARATAVAFGLVPERP